MRSIPYLLSACMTLLVALSYVHLVSDSPPWGSDWRDGQIALGMLIGVLATVDAVVLLLRAPLPLAALAWIWILAFSGLVLMLACWMMLVIRTVS